MAIAPSKPLLNDTTKSVIVAPDGTPASLPTVILTGDEARLLREYKKFLDRHRIKEAAYCTDCWEHNLQHGMDAYVTHDQILFRCRCRALYFQGPTY